jgi:PAS domain-containing protein
MEVSSYVENQKIHEIGTQLSDRFYHDCLKALGGAGEDAAMVLDDRGHVLFCNGEGATVFNSTPDNLAGKHLSEFVLNIRLNAWTPGSNVAYATFTGRRNQWREYCVLDPTGQGFPVELLLDVLVVNLRYLILLWVRTPARRAGSREPQLPDSKGSNRDAVVAA